MGQKMCLIKTDTHVLNIKFKSRIDPMSSPLNAFKGDYLVGSYNKCGEINADGWKGTVVLDEIPSINDRILS